MPREPREPRDVTCEGLILIFLSEYGVLLTELTLQPESSPPLRQMAALLLKKYVDTHWSSDSDKFQPPEATPQAKATIRNMLPHGLKESISKVRIEQRTHSNYGQVFAKDFIGIFL